MFDAEKSHLFDQDTERLLSPQQDCGDAVIQMMKVISKIQSALKIFQSWSFLPNRPCKQLSELSLTSVHFSAVGVINESCQLWVSWKNINLQTSDYFKYSTVCFTAFAGAWVSATYGLVAGKVHWAATTVNIFVKMCLTACVLEYMVWVGTLASQQMCTTQN